MVSVCFCWSFWFHPIPALEYTRRENSWRVFLWKPHDLRFFFCSPHRKGAVTEFIHFFGHLSKLLSPNECFLKWRWNDNYKMELKLISKYSKTYLPGPFVFLFSFLPALVFIPTHSPWWTTWERFKPISVFPIHVFLTCMCYLWKPFSIAPL